MNVDLRNYIWDFGNELPKGWLHYNYNYGGGGKKRGRKEKEIMMMIFFLPCRNYVCIIN